MDYAVAATVGAWLGQIAKENLPVLMPLTSVIVTNVIFTSWSRRRKAAIS
jgi:hypothetical protein